MIPPRPLAAATAGALALAVVITHPVLGAPGGAALGHPMVDTYNHLWGFWQVGVSLAGLSSPLHTALMRWPDGGSLWFIDLFNALWTLPIQWIFGPVAAYNLALVANLTLAGVAAWALARRVTGDGAAAAFAGAAYEACPHVLGQLYDGISESVSTGWLPLVLLAALRFRERPGPRRGLVAGAMLGLCAISNWYYGLFAGLIIAGLVIDALIPAGWRRWAVRRRLGWPALSAAALVLPALAAFRSTLNAGDALVLRDPEFVGRTLIGHNMVDIVSFFRPGDHHSPDLLTLFDEQMIVVVYLGWSLLLPALWVVRHDRRARPWAAGALMAFVLSLGAYLYLGGSYLEIPGLGWLALPFLFLFEQLPLFSPISHAFRFVVVVQLCLAVMGALAVSALGRRFGGTGAIAVALSGAFLVEVLAFSPARFPLPTAPVAVPAAYDAIAGEGAVLDLPVSIQVLARSRYNLFQLDHGRPIPYGLNDPTPPALYNNPLTRRVIALERSSVDRLAAGLPPLELALGRRALVRQGFSAIVVHLPLYPPEMRDRVLELLTLALGEGARVGDQVVFTLI